MIAFLKGRVAGHTPEAAFIEVNGMGFSVGMPARDLARLPERGGEVMVYTHLAVREDAMALYGFLSQEAHALFLRLIGVSGVGPKVALAALSTFKPEAGGSHPGARCQGRVQHSRRGQENRAAPHLGIERLSCRDAGGHAFRRPACAGVSAFAGSSRCTAGHGLFGGRSRSGSEGRARFRRYGRRPSAVCS